MKNLNPVSVILVAMALVFTMGCSQEKGVTMSFGSEVAQNSILDFLMPSAFASSTQVKMCFKRLRFKIDQQATTDKDNSPDNIDFAIGEVTVSETGATLGTVDVPAGNYRRVEFDLDNDCDTGYSIQVTNSHGTFETHSALSLNFLGDFTSDESAQSLVFAIESILSAASSYDGTGQLKAAVEAAEGEF